MMVLEFGDYRIHLTAREWRILTATASDTAIGHREPTCSDAGLVSLALADADVVALALALEALRQGGSLDPALVALGKDLLDYADLASARGLTITA